MLKLFKYEIPFKHPFSNQIFHYEYRSGLIISYTTSQITSYGEIAPLPHFSLESLKECYVYLKKNRYNIEKYIDNYLQNGGLPNPNTPHPSLNFGLSCLLIDTLSKHNPKLYQQNIPKHTLPKILLNTTIATSDISSLQQYITLKTNQEFRHIKLKCGFFTNSLPNILHQLIEQNPSVKWRLDVNRQWNFDLAKKIFSKLTCHNIEYCEEPLIPKELHFLPLLKKITSIPIAGDESLHRNTTFPPPSPLDEFQVIIIKPMFIGSYATIKKWIQWAEKNKKKIVFTTALEGFIGRMATIRLTSWFCHNPTIAHGLDTRNHLQYDYTSNQEEKIKNNLIYSVNNHFIPPFEFDNNRLIRLTF